MVAVWIAVAVAVVVAVGVGLGVVVVVAVAVVVGVAVAVAVAVMVAVAVGVGVMGMFMHPSRWCKNCRTHHWEGEACFPEWLVWCEEDGEDCQDARIVHAQDAQSAAERWAELDDSESSDYRIVSGSDVVVHVIERVHSEAGGEAERWTVCGESVPEYRANKLKGRS